jgi:hypothetical protein
MKPVSRLLRGLSDHDHLQRHPVSVPGKKRRDVELEFELGPSFDRFLAAKPEFSYEAVCTVNLLALRLQWFESTPTQASYRGILQELPFEAVNARKRPVFQQVHKKTLCQVLGVVRRMPAEPSEDVERIPIKPAQLG